MVKYANKKGEAVIIAQKMRHADLEHADNVQICETCDEGFGIYAKTELGRYVITNETE